MTANQLVEVCGDPGLAYILVRVRRFLKIIYLIGPIIAMAGITYHLIKLVFSPEGKKNKPLLKNWLIAFFMLFLVPVLINVVIGLFDNTFQFAACWTAAANSNYEDKNDYFDDTSDDGDRSKLDDFSGIESSGNSNTDSSSGSSKSESTVINTRFWVGDSRTDGMRSAVTENEHNVWSCKSSMGLYWMQHTGIPNIVDKISSNSAIIILMGVNDLSNSMSYVKYVNSQVSSWNQRGAKVYFVSVNPTDGGYSYLDARIKSFNSDLKNNLDSSIKYINTYNYLTKKGFSTTDGLHYTNDTYKKIYNYVVKHL